jgi:hypothetical protein
VVSDPAPPPTALLGHPHHPPPTSCGSRPSTPRSALLHPPPACCGSRPSNPWPLRPLPRRLWSAPKLRTDTEGCGFGQGDRVFTHVLMNALMPSLLKHTLHPDPSQGHNARGAPSVVPSPPTLSSLLFVVDTSSIVPLLSFIGGFTIQHIKLCRPYRYPLGGCLTSHTTMIIATVLIIRALGP